MNVLACNRDDHLRNFAFIMDREGVWRLSPLFDFTFHEGPAGWHTLSIAGEGRNPGVDHLRQLGAIVELRPRDVAAAIDRARDVVSRFPALARDAGLRSMTIDRVGERMNAIAAT
jgi:serine/threonine-protein kinase HipA